MLFKDRRGVNFSCASPASAAICASIEPRSIVQPAWRDARRRRAINPPPPPQTPSKAKPYNQKMSIKHGFEPPAVSLVSPATSSRCLLNDDAAFSDAFPPATAVEPSKTQSSEEEVSSSSISRPPSSLSSPSSSSSSSSSSKTQDQVVVLRVSLHCKGCEAKVKKHISKMEGVKSFSIDFAKKKVTVVGDVTPLGVLNSVSKVKHAQFWPLPPPTTAPAAPPALQ